ncbi:hypothetical protein BE21_37825 [Sorangium cellulosum]|uniref:Amine oxidase domain-containing protein n=1 Tax=Sorangium cellulosum TaxID=56 RepID=A0A150TMH7_SORCE|nr:hypothetical protein BE21_37825 [Sorangium cellulosum]
MLDTAIIGGGVCGLSLSRSLSAVGADYQLFEARDRLGGRVLSVPAGPTRVDLGPTWFWPVTQPLMSRLVDELELASFAQHDDGPIMVLSHPNKTPERYRGDTGLHGGGLRLVGGMGSLVDALAGAVPRERVHLGHVLEAVELDDAKVLLRFARGDGGLTVEARRVVLALPPRLLAENVRFTPELPTPLRQAMTATPTWMAAQAKAVLTYRQPSWREDGLSGNAFVTHGQAVFGEIFDASDPLRGLSALGAFLALPAGARARFAAELPLLIDKQIAQVFGEHLSRVEQHYKDWATDRFTCSARDREERPAHIGSGHPLLRQPYARGQVFFGAAETASYAAGYLEGALDAARRIRRDLA